MRFHSVEQIRNVGDSIGKHTEITRLTKRKLCQSYKELQGYGRFGKRRKFNHRIINLGKVYHSREEGIVTFDSSYTCWMIFKADNIDMALKIVDSVDMFLIGGYHITSPYDCTGEHFSNGVTIREIYKGHWVATQWWGVDL